jgi:polyhydroxyalkanoate synthesis regulator phasin
MSNQLTTLDRSNLRKLESTIEKGIETFIEVGSALKQIRDQKLYREGFKSFDSYVQEKWMLSRRYAYQLIESAEVAQNVHHGAQNPVAIPNERTARELGKLPPEEQPKVWDEVVSSTPNPTHKDVEAHVQRKLSETDPEPEAKSFIDEVMGNAEQAKDIQKAIQSAIRMTNAISDSPGLELIAAKQKSIVAHLENAKSAVSVSIPVDVCPKCSGDGCANCGNFGWINSLLKN